MCEHNKQTEKGTDASTPAAQKLKRRIPNETYPKLTEFGEVGKIRYRNELGEIDILAKTKDKAPSEFQKRITGNTKGLKSKRTATSSGKT